MPGPSDELLDVVVALLAEKGFEGTTIRAVAARAGVSVGAVQHHFRTKDALLAGALHRVEEAVGSDLSGRAGAAPDPRTALRAVAHGLVPAGDEEIPAGVVWLVTAARAAVDDGTAAHYRPMWRRVQDALLLRWREARPDLDAAEAEDEAASLLALLDGLAAARVAEPARMPADRAHRLVDRHLDALLGPRQRTDG